MGQSPDRVLNVTLAKVSYPAGSTIERVSPRSVQVTMRSSTVTDAD